VERIRAKWHQNDARTFILEAHDKSFNECDTPMLANGAEAGCDRVGGEFPFLTHIPA